MDCPYSRIDIIGSNGGEGLHYTKKCNHCGVEKPLIDYHVDQNRKDGRKNTCASCIVSEQKERHSKDYRKYLLRTARHRAKKNGIVFSITEEDLELVDVCPVLGIPLETGKHNHPNSPSIDKVIPQLGYVKGNVRVISRRANTIKNDATIEELFAVAYYVRNHCLEHTLVPPVTTLDQRSPANDPVDYPDPPEAA
jgi:hypothetical protein